MVVDGRDVAGVEEAFVVQDLAAFIAEIGAGDGRALDHQTAIGRAVVRHVLTRVVLQLQLDAQRRRALLDAPLQLLLERQGGQFRRHVRQGADGRGLGHAPALQHLDPKLVVEGADHAFRHGGAADQHALDRRELQIVLAQMVQQTLPDGRHGG
ncbi:hypothetical protein D3C72_1393610 [compost metagenome]